MPARNPKPKHEHPDQEKQEGPERMVRGTIIQLSRKCGKKSCRCAEGEPHVSWALSYSLQGRTHMLTVRPEEVEALRRDLERYQKAAEALEQRALAGIEAWRRRRS